MTRIIAPIANQSQARPTPTSLPGPVIIHLARWMHMEKIGDIDPAFGWTRGYRRREITRHAYLSAFVGRDLVGGMCLSPEPGELDVVRVAVVPAWRLRGVGRAMLGFAAENFTGDLRDRLVATARESDVSALVFLRQCGFRHAMTLRGYCDDTGEDAYTLERKGGR